MTESLDSTAIKKCSHHNRYDLCTTRPAYRQGRKLTAVKVYTVNEESQHLIIRGVPALSLHKELKHLCMRYGDVKGIHVVTNYAEDEESFTEVYHVLFARIQSARFAKHMIDDRAFFGGILHVCYAPELESLSETRQKLMQRNRDVRRRIKRSDAPGRKCDSSSVQCESHTDLSSQEISTFTHADGGIIEQTYIPNKRDPSSHNSKKNFLSNSLLTNENELTGANASRNSKRNRAIQFLPSSLKRIKMDPYNRGGISKQFNEADV